MFCARDFHVRVHNRLTKLFKLKAGSNPCLDFGIERTTAFLVSKNIIAVHLTFRFERECIFGIFVMIDFIYIDVDYSDKMIVKFTYKSILAE